MKLVAILALAVLALGSVSNAEVATANLNADVAIANYEKLGFQSETEMKNYFNVVDVKVTEIPSPAAKSQLAAPATEPALKLGSDILGSLGPVLMDPSSISAWIAFGQKAWEVVVANKPVVNVQTTRVTVLPNDKTAWAQMSGWHSPATASYELAFTNGYGATVVDHKYTVSYNYGGQYNGQGRYLANVTIIPTAVDVWWGFNLDSRVEVGQILNTGSTQSPVPAVDLQLKWDVKTILQEHQGTDSFFVKGDGSLQHLSN